MLPSHRVVTNREIMLGKPVIRGTRLTVELLVHKLAEGTTVTELLQLYPQLEAADIEASLQYAAAKATG